MQDAAVYGPAGEIAIEPPRGERLAGIAAVVIAAYLHDAEIARKDPAMGFRGPVYTLRAPIAGTAGRHRKPVRSRAGNRRQASQIKSSPPNSVVGRDVGSSPPADIEMAHEAPA